MSDRDNPTADESVCPEKDSCLSLKGKPIGMYHCSHCGEMIIAGQDPSVFCPRIECLDSSSEDDRHGR